MKKICIKNSCVFSMVFFCFSVIVGSEKEDLLLTNIKIKNLTLQKKLNAEIAEWATKKYLLTKDDQFTLSKIEDVDNKTNRMFSFITTNFLKTLEIHMPIKNPQGLAFFKEKNIISLIEELNNLRTTLPVVQLKDIKEIFVLLQNIEQKDIKKNTIPESLEDTLIDHYHALLYWAEGQEKIITEFETIINLSLQDSIEKKWPLLVSLIQKKLTFQLTSTFNMAINKTRKQINNIISVIQNISTDPEQYKIAYNKIIQEYALYQIKINNKPKFRNLKELYVAIIKWEKKQKLNSVEREKEITPTSNEISHLLSDLQFKVKIAYKSIKEEDKKLIAWHNFPRYNHMFHAINNLEPQHESEFEGAFYLIMNAYDMYQKIMLNITKEYANWAIDNALLTKEDIENENLETIIYLIQEALDKRIDILLTYINRPTLTEIKNFIENQPTLFTLNSAYTAFLKEKEKIKKTCISWAINNVLIVEEEVKNKDLESVILIIQQALLNRINQLPENVEKNILQNKVKKSKNFSELTAFYLNYLSLKNNKNLKNLIEQPKAIQPQAEIPQSIVKVPLNNQESTHPKNSSWWQWPSWLRWSFYK